MQALTAAQRATAVNTLADLLVSREKFILDANAKDLAEAQKSGLAKPLLSRLSLNSAKLKNLSIGLKQIADDSHKVSAKWKTNWVKKNGELIEIAFWKSLRKLHLFCCRKILLTCPRKHNGELLGGTSLQSGQFMCTHTTTTRVTTTMVVLLSICSSDWLDALTTL